MNKKNDGLPGSQVRTAIAGCGPVMKAIKKLFFKQRHKNTSYVIHIHVSQLILENNNHFKHFEV